MALKFVGQTSTADQNIEISKANTQKISSSFSVFIRNEQIIDWLEKLLKFT